VALKQELRDRCIPYFRFRQLDCTAGMIPLAGILIYLLMGG
jgi:hypothetical protein